MGCWYDIHDDSEIKPYWGCYAKTEEQRKIVAKILDKAGVPHADIIEWTTRPHPPWRRTFPLIHSGSTGFKIIRKIIPKIRR